MTMINIRSSLPALCPENQGHNGLFSRCMSGVCLDVWDHLLEPSLQIEGIENWPKLGGRAAEGCDGYFLMAEVAIRGRSGPSCRLDHHPKALDQNGGQPACLRKWGGGGDKYGPNTLVKRRMEVFWSIFSFFAAGG